MTAIKVWSEASPLISIINELKGAINNTLISMLCKILKEKSFFRLMNYFGKYEVRRKEKQSEMICLLRLMMFVPELESQWSSAHLINVCKAL